MLFFLTNCKKNNIDAPSSLEDSNRDDKVILVDTSRLDNTMSVRAKLFKIYNNGSISECQHNGKLVYTAGLNAYDAGSSIFDKEGKRIGTCNYAWGRPDSICLELSKCEVIYRVEDNIWGQPAVNKINLED